jgi:hypothetical protein
LLLRKTNLPLSPVEEAAAARAATRIWEHGNTGNFGNQQGTSQYDIGDEFEQEFEGFEVELAPENETTCEQVVQQAAAASSWWRSWW